MGETRGDGEQIIACTEGREPADAATGQKTAYLALDPCLTPVCCALLHTDFPPSCCLLSHPPSLFGKTRRSVAQDSRHAAFQA
jgi:hypothetical protein